MLTKRYRRREGSLSLYRPQPKSASRVQQVYTSLRNPSLPPMDQSVASPTVRVPLSDMNIPCISMVKSLTEIPDISAVENLPPLPPVYEHKFGRIFKKKVQMCMHICSFTGDKSEEPVIAVKTRVLEEILSIFTGTACVTDSLEDQEIQELFDMCKKNILRTIHPLNAQFLLHDDLPTPEEPTWPHLSLVYQIINRLAVCIPCSPLFSIPFLKELVASFESSDPNERNMLVQLFMNIVRGNSHIVGPLIDLFEKVLIEYRLQEFASPFIPATVLPILAFVFDHTAPPLPSFHRIFSKGIVQLFGDRYYQTYGEPVKRIVEVFVDDNVLHAREVVDMIAGRWAITKPDKQVMLMPILYDTTAKLAQRDVRQRITKVLKIIAMSITSEHEKVALVALGLWQKLDNNEAITNHFKLAVSILVPPLCHVMASHWSQNVRTTAKSALNILQRYDLKLVQEHVRQFRSSAVSIEEMTETAKPKKWTSIARTAFDKRGDFNLSATLQDITRAFTEETPRDVPDQSHSQQYFYTKPCQSHRPTVMQPLVCK